MYHTPPSPSVGLQVMAPSHWDWCTHPWMVVFVILYQAPTAPSPGRNCLLLNERLTPQTCPSFPETSQLLSPLFHTDLP
ncbi:hypothetical protein BDZ94DRAFT_1275550 [Collybia nuda]|uniref:Uncharacterized protein n=1 Tax=Collybia nuda TaxID=64659 RepID=A0A9P5XVU4_9AGAR|nr:hypothetical protein BDZ94DRAFT_1275550 [Collybia nuda]